MSRGPYASCNLGDHVGDDAGSVAENRRRVAERLGVAPAARWAWLRQLHGAEVRVVDGAVAAGSEPPEADAAVTAVAGTPLVVCTADCAPLALLADDAVGVVHAGWPGLLAGVVEAGVAALRRLTGGPVRAVLGPCVRPAGYEFGRADLDRLVARFGADAEARTATGEPALDVAAAVRVACERSGVERFDDAGADTLTDPARFSYRRDGLTGREALVAVLDP